MPGMLGGRRGVPLAVPLPFLLTGIAAAALFGCLLPWVVPQAMLAPAFPHVLALVHTITLGWLTMTIIGASLQLTPVIIVGPLRAQHFIRWLYPLYAAGVSLLLSGFWWSLPWLLIVGGCLVVLAIIWYLLILGNTLAHASSRPLTVRFQIASLAYLTLVVSLGLTAAFNFRFAFLGTTIDQLLPIHITIGVVGWLSCTWMGVSYTLVRLFALAHEHNDRLGKCVFVLLNLVIITLVSALLLSSWPLLLLGGAALSLAFWLFAYDYWRMLHIRQRKILDVTQYHGIVATAYSTLVVPASLAVVLTGVHHTPLLVALALATLIGMLGQSVIGYLYKIVPFLVWHTRYGPLVGHQAVPLMRDLLHERWCWLSFWLLNISLLALIPTLLAGLTLLVQLASALLGLGLLLAALNVCSVVLHLSNLPFRSNPSA